MATALQPGPNATLSVSDGDAVKVDFFYLTKYGRQYSRPAATGRTTAAKLAPLVQVLPAVLPATAASDGTTGPGPRWQAGVQVGIAGLLSGWSHPARQQQRLQALTGAGVMNVPGWVTPLTDLPPYVRWELRDDDGVLLNSGTVDVPVVGDKWAHFSTRLAVDASGTDSRTGHLTVQLLNDGSLPVYFDSLTIRQPRPALYIAQENHYYPFGMNLSGVAVNTQPADAMSKLQYNGGSELEDGLLDAESGNYSTPYRRYDPTIGRFLGVDPLADKYSDYSPYNFALNDPANLNDPSGADALSDLAVNNARLMGEGTTIPSMGDGAGGHGEGGGHGGGGPGQTGPNGEPLVTVKGQTGYWTEWSAGFTSFTHFNPVSGGAGIGGSGGYAWWPASLGGGNRQQGRHEARWDLDGDGKFQKKEADNWWLHGGGAPAYVNNAKIDWTGLKIPAKLSVNGGFAISTTDAFLKLRYETAATYGGTSFKVIGTNLVQVQDQRYHYDMRTYNSAENISRNIATKLGMPTGQGTDFMIIYYTCIVPASRGSGFG